MSVKTNTIEERTADAGVTIDGLLIKDGGLPSLPGAGITSDQALVLAAYQVAMAAGETGEALLKTAEGVEFGAVGGANYTTYVATISQSGTSAPVATVLENTIGPIVWARAADGRYTATLANAFPSAAKTFCLIGTPYPSSTEFFAHIQRSSTNVVTVRTAMYVDPGTLLDDVLLIPVTVEIRVYP